VIRRTPWAVVISVTLAALTAGTLGVSADAADLPLPMRLAHVGDSRQVVVVTAANWDTSYARLQTWQRSNAGQWEQVMGPVPARVGWSGFQREQSRLQNTGKTPAGTFSLLRGFGMNQLSGVDIPYRVVDNDDWWPYDPTDPTTYNVQQFHRVHHARWRTAWAEHLRSYTTQYRFAVVIDYNLPSGIRWRNGQRIATEPADTSKGGGIFLHVDGSGPTAGCISVSRHDMRSVLRWLDPDLQPIIVMGPRSVIGRM
jgi:L,D-peptidoglycan transpeptidase YkuD (ErfK/YbiS/YcfS/YnhG family)